MTTEIDEDAADIALATLLGAGGFYQYRAISPVGYWVILDSCGHHCGALGEHPTKADAARAYLRYLRRVTP
jgi:hypothetical protein